MTRWRWLSVALACLVLYAQAPLSELVWDDRVVAGLQLHEIFGIGDALRPPRGLPNWAYDYYRPLITLSFMLDARLFGAGARAGPHAMNVLFHLLATLGAMALARRLLGAVPGAATGTLVAGLVFATHPIHAESVNWIAGRSDVLCAMLVFPALLLALRWRDARSISALLLSALCYLLALLAKETAVTALALLALALALAPRAPGDGAAADRLGWLAPGIAFTAVTAAYLALREYGGASAGPARDADLLAQGWGALRATAWYFLKLLQPWPQSAAVSWEMLPGRAVSLALVAALLAGSAWAYRYWRRSAGGVPLFAAGWFWAGIALPLWVAVGLNNNTPIAERYLYLPSFAAALAAGAACALPVARRARLAATGLALTACAVFALLTVQRGAVWRTEVALWTDATAHAAAPGLAWSNLGMTHVRRGDDAAALPALQEAVRRARGEPDWPARSQYEIGAIRLRAGAFDAAAADFAAAGRLDPNLHLPWFGLGQLHAARARALQARGARAQRNAAIEESLNAFVAATSRNARHAPSRVAMAALLLDYGRWLEAEGDANHARRRYRAGLGQLDAMPVETSGQTLPDPAADAARARAPELRAAIAARLAALGG